MNLLCCLLYDTADAVRVYVIIARDDAKLVTAEPALLWLGLRRRAASIYAYCQAYVWYVSCIRASCFRKFGTAVASVLIDG
jgi:hypothetical protein